MGKPSFYCGVGLLIFVGTFLWLLEYFALAIGFNLPSVFLPSKLSVSVWGFFHPFFNLFLRGISRRRIPACTIIKFKFFLAISNINLKPI